MKAQRAQRALRALRTQGTQAPRHVRRRAALAADATTEPEPGPGPEAVFDRVTGPYGAPRAYAYDEEP
jgi:hypothetical protein